MTTRKILLLIVTCTCVANAKWWPWQKNPEVEPTPEQQIPEEVVPDVPEVPAEPVIPKVQGGVVVSLGKQFLLDEQTNMLRNLVNTINWKGQTAVYTGQLSDFVQDTGYPHMEVAVKNFKIQDSSNLLTTAEHTIELNGESECVSGSIRNIDNIEFDFEFEADSDFLLLKGEAKIQLTNVSFEYRVQPFTRNTSDSFYDQGKIGFEIQYFNVTAETSYELAGNNLDQMDGPFGQFLNTIFGPEHAFSERELFLFQHSINSDVIDYNSYMKLYGDSIEVDYQLVGEEWYITDDYFAVVTDGTFRPYNSGEEIQFVEHAYGSNIPLHIKDANVGPAQIIISDYTMNSLASAVEDLGWFDRTFSVKASSVDTYISDYEAAYGTSMQDLVDVVCTPVKGEQRVTFSEETDTMSLKFLLEAHVANPLKPSQDAASIVLEIDASVKLEVDFQYKLTGKLQDIDMKVFEFKPYFNTHTTKDILESQMQFLERFAGQSYLNEILSEGLEVPIPDWIKSSMAQPQVTAYDGYIVFDSDPKVFR